MRPPKNSSDDYDVNYGQDPNEPSYDDKLGDEDFNLNDDEMTPEERAIAMHLYNLITDTSEKVRTSILEHYYDKINISATKLVQLVTKYVRSYLVSLPNDPLEASMITLGAAQCIVGCAKYVKYYIEDKKKRDTENRKCLQLLKERMTEMTPEERTIIENRPNFVNLGIMRKYMRWKERETERLKKEHDKICQTRKEDFVKGMTKLEMIAHIIHCKPNEKELTAKEIGRIMATLNKGDEKALHKETLDVIKRWMGSVFDAGKRPRTFRLIVPIEVVFQIRYRGVTRAQLIKRAKQ